MPLSSTGGQSWWHRVFMSSVCRPMHVSVWEYVCPWCWFHNICGMHQCISWQRGTG